MVETFHLSHPKRGRLKMHETDRAVAERKRSGFLSQTFRRKMEPKGGEWDGFRRSVRPGRAWALFFLVKSGI